VGFHLALAEATGSSRIVAAMTEVHGELTDLLDRVSHPPSHLEEANDQHRRIVRLVREGDANGAVLVMRDHLDRTERALEEQLP
jgi:DNA-binding GntR family transcriptional regulator